MAVKIRRLNTLRGMAALIVVVSHYSNVSGLWNKVLGEGAGQLGVMLFFLLSGFLMSYLYFDLPASAQNLRNFLAARIARVVPLFYGVVIISFVLTRFAVEPYNTLLYSIGTVPLLFSHLLFLHGESVLWTIPPEIQFYALFAAAWAFRARLGSSIYPLIGLILIADYFLGFTSATRVIAGFTVSPIITQALPYFIAGGILGWLYHRWRVPVNTWNNCYLSAVILVPLLYPVIFACITGRQHAMWADPGVWLILVAVFFALVFLVPDRNLLLENPVGDFFGRISYSLYLLHAPVLVQLSNAGLAQGILGLVIFIGAASMVAYASFALFEAPSRRILFRILACRAD
jgi:peptidoglycan/LPS O-acetylase OafA/YrhL